MKIETIAAIHRATGENSVENILKYEIESAKSQRFNPGDKIINIVGEDTIMEVVSETSLHKTCFVGKLISHTGENSCYVVGKIYDTLIYGYWKLLNT